MVNQDQKQELPLAKSRQMGGRRGKPLCPYQEPLRYPRKLSVGCQS